MTSKSTKVISIKMSSNNLTQEIVAILKDYQIKETTISRSIFAQNDGEVFKVQAGEIKTEKPEVRIQPQSEIRKQEHKIEEKIEQKAQAVTKPIPKEKTPSQNEILVQKIKNEIREIKSISELYEYIKNSDFSEVKKISNNTVIGQGIENANILLIGEAPGEEEDKNGVPFCGRSGRLLDNVLKSINLSRDKNIYITNSFFWRPPANRKPTNDEILSCRPIVQKIIEIISPKLIILCGATAIESVVENKTIKISDARSIFEKIKIGNAETYYTSIYHPSYLLRNPSAKKIAWQDMMAIANFISQNKIQIN